MTQAGIHDEIINAIVAHLQTTMIDNETDDDYKAGVIRTGPLQGDPDPDTARISVTVHENDPDDFSSGVPREAADKWNDMEYEVEIGGCSYWNRPITIKARCLLVNTQEPLANARNIASVIRKKIEQAIRSVDYSTINVNGEIVSHPYWKIQGEMYQAGGPESYDYHIKVRLVVQTMQPW